MQEEQTVIHIYITDSCTSFTVSRHIRKLIILSESFPVVCRTNTSGDIQFLRNNVIPNTVDGMNISSITSQSSHIGHTRIHVSSTHCMSYCLILFNYRFVSLTVFIPTRSITTLIQEEFSLVQIFLFTCYQIQLSQCHLCNLMTWHTYLLPRFVTNLPADTVCITNGYIQEIPLSRSLIVCNGTFYHVT